MEICFFYILLPAYHLSYLFINHAETNEYNIFRNYKKLYA